MDYSIKQKTVNSTTNYGVDGVPSTTETTFIALQCVGEVASYVASYTTLDNVLSGSILASIYPIIDGVVSSKTIGTFTKVNTVINASQISWAYADNFPQYSADAIEIFKYVLAQIEALSAAEIAEEVAGEL